MKKEVRKFDKKVKIGDAGTITIGGRSDSTICITELEEATFVIRSGQIEKKSNETAISINGYMIEDDKAKFNECDFIGLNDILAYYVSGYLYFSDDIKLDTSLMVENIRESNNHLEYPQFYRSVRQLYKIPDESIEVLQPKAPTEDDRQGLLATILPAAISMAMMFMMRMSMGRNLFFLIICVVMMLSSGGVSVYNYISQSKKLNDKKEKRLVKYGEYIEKTENKIIEAREKETRLLNQKYPSITELVKNVEDFDARLFERKPSNEDFLVYSLGTGRHDAISKISFKKQEYVELEDPLMDIPEQLHDKYEHIDDMPIILPLKDANAVSFIGVRNKLFQMLKNMILQLSISHFYEDVKMCIFMDEADVGYVSWVRWLHNFCDDHSGRRYIAFNEESSNKLLENLYTILSKRSESRSIAHPHYVVFVYKTERFYAHPIVNYIKRAGDLGFTFVLFEEYPEFVNPDCTSRIFLNEQDNTGYIQKAMAGEDVQHFRYTHVSSKTAKYVSMRLSPVYIEETSLESNLVKKISLYELLHINNAKQLNFKERWEESRIYESMAAPLGLKAGDELISLDLHERFHGPHGLVAGTTGSGKSEILQSYILSMATLFHPYEVSFIIIDFKGGGMVNQFKNLPHLNGAITNIDGKQIDRSLKSIKAELLKRQRLFADMEVNHIDDYIRKFKNGETNIPLPHLILIVDEFAELKSEQPEFMKELISAARIGRSLGVHLILATQKPAGVVNEQIWSNSNFKLCLKVQNASDSNEVIKSPLAAEIREPGRAYLQVGNNEIFELFQSAYSGAKISDANNDVPEYTINIVGLDGSRMPIFVNKKAEGESDITELDEIVKAVAEYCDEAEIEKMQNICLPPLEELIICDYADISSDEASLAVPIGVYDDPSNHYQGTNSISLIEENVCIVGSAGTGKTNMLLNIIKGITMLYTPEDVNIYVLDFASLLLVSVRDLCYVSGVITSRDDELLVSFFNNMREEVESRKEQLSDMGYGSYANYRQAGKRDLPHIVIMLDNAVAFKEMFPDYVDVLAAICRDGLSVGISVIYTASQVSALGYRANAYFSKNIALNCNDRSSYASMFERNRLYPDELPGRYITDIDKCVYEAQAYIPFEYDKYDNMVDAISEFIATVNAKYDTSSVKKMKAMAEQITDDYLKELGYQADSEKILIGVEHVSLDIHQMNLKQSSVLGILNGNDGEEIGYIRYVLRDMIGNGAYNISIVDGVSRRLSAYNEHNNVSYTNNLNDLSECVSDIYTKVKTRYDMVLEGQVDTECPVEVLVINMVEAYDVLNNDLVTNSKFTKICSQFKGMGVMVILADLPNANLSFGGATILRTILPNMDLLIFKEANEQKLIELPARFKNNKKKRAVNDVFYLHGSQIHRVRVPFVESRED